MIEERLMFIVADEQMAVPPQRRAGRTDFEVLVKLAVGIDLQERSAAKQQFSLAPRRTFGVARRFGILLEFYVGESLGQVARFVFRSFRLLNRVEIDRVAVLLAGLGQGR